jgi:hypothetical protein
MDGLPAEDGAVHRNGMQLLVVHPVGGHPRYGVLHWKQLFCELR